MIKFRLFTFLYNSIILLVKIKLSEIAEFINSSKNVLTVFPLC